METNQFKKNIYEPKDSNMVFLLVMVFPYIAFFITYLIVMAFGGSFDNLLGTIFSCVIGQISFLVIYFVYNKKQSIDFVKATNLNFSFKWWWAPLAGATSLVSLFGLNQFCALFDTIISKCGYKLPTGFLLPLDNFWWFLLAVALVAVLPAIAEELIFRGVVLNGFRKKLGVNKAVVLSAAMFAIFHGSLAQLIYPFILGIVFGYIATNSKSVIPGMIAHFLNNFVIILIYYIEAQKSTGVASELPTWTAWSIVLAIALALATAAVLFALFFFLGKKRIKNQSQDEETNVSIDEIKKPWFDKFLFAGIVFTLVLIVSDIVSNVK